MHVLTLSVKLKVHESQAERGSASNGNNGVARQAPCLQVVGYQVIPALPHKQNTARPQHEHVQRQGAAAAAATWHAYNVSDASEEVVDEGASNGHLD